MIEIDGNERRNAFLRLLASRAEVVGRRLERFAESGWDINGIALIHGDAGRLIDGGREFGLDGALAPLDELATLLDGVLLRESLPDDATSDRLCVLGRELLQLVPDVPPAPDPMDAADDLEEVSLAAMHAGGESSFHAHADAWSDAAPRFAQGAIGDDGKLHARPGPRAAGGPTRPTDLAANPAQTPSPAQVAARATMSPASLVPNAAPAVAPPSAAPDEPAPTAASPAARGPTPVAGAASDGGTLLVPANFRIYHLSACGPLSLAMDQRFEAQGLEVELLEDPDELNELLSAIPADLVLVDADFSEHLENIGAAVRLARGRSNKQRLLLVAIVDADDITLRLSARRAGVDALLVAPADVAEVFAKLQPLVDPAREESFRILIVEDDRSQALFAEGILRNAGMDSLVVIDALDVMPALKQFRPDLVLMDLNMPGANGIELTALIREQDAFAHTPIVFLSGESSEDLQFDAIDAGGDDFLSKPIRPRHLISAVQTRVRRHRQQESRRARRPDKDAATGLVYRKTLLQQLEAELGAGQQLGGLIFLELDNLGLLRERIGLTALEILLGDVARLLTHTLGEQPATRFGDGSFLVLDRQREELGLDSLATQLRQVLMHNAFEALGHPLRLRLSAGVAAFRHDFGQADAMINAVEKVAREARAHERGVRRYEPPRATEALKEASLLGMVREALEKDTLSLLYQPVVAVAGNDLSQYQTLLRLRDADGVLHSAAEIIPMAERSSLIVDIDRWVMSQALALIQERSAEGQVLRLFVTQSSLTLAAPDQVEWLSKELADGGIDGACVVIELRLEDVAVHLGTVKHFCEAMGPERVRFCLSQFEAGRESESLVDQLPLAFVKLARKYTAGTLGAPMREELKGLIERVHRRQLQVIGHGVEDAQAAATLWMSGIDFIQGNLVQQAGQEMSFDFNQAVL